MGLSSSFLSISVHKKILLAVDVKSWPKSCHACADQIMSVVWLFWCDLSVWNWDNRDLFGGLICMFSMFWQNYRMNHACVYHIHDVNAKSFCKWLFLLVMNSHSLFFRHLLPGSTVGTPGTLQQVQARNQQLPGSTPVRLCEMTLTDPIVTVLNAFL